MSCSPLFLCKFWRFERFCYLCTPEPKNYKILDEESTLIFDVADGRVVAIATVAEYYGGELSDTLSGSVYAAGYLLVIYYD